MVVSSPHFHTGRLDAEYAVVGDWQAFMRLCYSLVARRHSFYEISSNARAVVPESAHSSHSNYVQIAA